jgi:fructose-specific component phosphotransferase system IIB-like protein
MNKFERNQLGTAEIFLANNMIDAAARTVSFLIRASRRTKAKAELMQFAQANNLVNHSDFIV